MGRWILFFLLAVLPIGRLIAQSGLQDPGTVQSKSISAVRLNSSITVDGVLDEPYWEGAAVASGFRQYEPDEGANPTFHSQVKILYDDRAIYIG
ncbi:MAG: hypothetical protein P8Y60_16315, partial [Calditrichota bacterium]